MPAPADIDFEWHATLTDWLAGVFRTPLSVTMVDNYRDGLGSLLQEALERERGSPEGALAMHQALIRDEATETAVRLLGIAFTELFEGIGGPRTVSPFESAHASPTGRLFQAPSRVMKQRLSKAQLTLSREDNEPADHLSIELALLARLMRRDASDDDQLALFDDHLLVWVPGFARAVKDQDNTGFYAGAASLLLDFLAERRGALANRLSQQGHASADRSRERIEPCRTE